MYREAGDLDRQNTAIQQFWAQVPSNSPTTCLRPKFSPKAPRTIPEGRIGNILIAYGEFHVKNMDRHPRVAQKKERQTDQDSSQYIVSQCSGREFPFITKAVFLSEE